ALFYVQVVAVIAILILVLSLKAVIFPSFQIFLLIIFIGFFGTVNVYIYYKAIRQGKLSVVIPITSSYALFAAIFSYIIFGELLSLKKYIAIGVIIIGTVLISTRLSELLKIKRIRLENGVFYAIIASIGFGLWAVLSKIVVNEIGGLSASLFLELFILIFLFTPLLFKRKILVPFNKKWSGLLIAGAVLLGVGIVGFNLAIMHGMVTIVTPIVAAAPLATVLFARLFLKEQIELNQIIGAVLVVLGVISVSL
ncbi:DMT family transporter, partial [Candidatus Woesearchaeota archaeon]|nr:DMT family transporter [Candidatus Woesearchaeota archaeon]